MDYDALYADLTKKLENEIPITAYPIRELGQNFRQNGNPITLKSKLTITSVFNTGDVSGIMCTVEVNEDAVHACSLTHLTFEPSFRLSKEILEYQRKRFKRIQQINKM